MQAIKIVKGEIHNVLTLLRLAARLAGTYDGQYEGPLIRGLKELNETLTASSDLGALDARSYLQPFLAVVVSDTTGADITGSALLSVHKFLVYGLIHADAPHAAEAMSNIAYYVTKCRFDARNRDDAEVVYMKILEILLECLRCPAGEHLTNNIVCNMITECFDIRARKGVSKLLMRYAENVLTQMVLVMFARLSPESSTGGREIQVTDTPATSSSDSKSTSTIASTTTTTATSSASTTPVLGTRALVAASHARKPSGSLFLDGTSRSAISISGATDTKEEKKSDRKLSSSISSDSVGSNGNGSDSSSERKPGDEPYGIIALQRVFKFLANLINPGDSANDETVRILGLRLIRTVLETAGPYIGSFPPLVQVIQDDLCKYLLLNSNTKNLYVMSLTLRIIFDLFSTVKQHLKVQFEVFFTSIHLRIGDSASTSFEQKELVMESLVDFCKEPSLIVGLYRNYDCELGSSYLFEDLCKFLAAGAPMARNRPAALSLLCLEGMLGMLDSISKRFCSDVPPMEYSPTNAAREKRRPSTTEEEDTSALTPEEEARIIQIRSDKKKLAQAAAMFNADGQKAWKAIQGLKVLTEPLTPESVVEFMRSTPSLDKVKIGEVLGGEKDFNQQVLAQWVKRFDVKSIQPVGTSGTGETRALRPDDALRAYLDLFKLPGEAQQIARIIEAFAGTVFLNCPGPILTTDAAYVLTYSIIMLNTDAHNPEVKKKMTKEEYIRMNRGVNNKTDFPRAYLEEIYDSIVNNEIKMTPDTILDLSQPGGEVEKMHTKRWNAVLNKSATTGPFQTTAPRQQGKDMFAMMWQNVITTFSAYMDQRSLYTSSHSIPKLVQKLVRGFHAFARICAAYQLTDIFNSLIIALSKHLCSALAEAAHDTNGSTPIVAFGRDLRAHAFARLLFQLTLEYGESSLLDGWTNVLHTILWMRHLDLLPPSLLELEDFRDSEGKVLESLRRTAPVELKPAAVSESGLGSLFSSVFSIFASDQSKVVDDDVRSRSSDNGSDNGEETDEELTKRARDCIAHCRIPEIFASTKYFQANCLTHLLRGLLLISSYGTNPTQHIDVVSKTILNEETAVFCLERIADVVEKNQSRLEDDSLPLMTNIVHHFETAIKKGSGVSEPTWYMERIVVNILRFSVRLIHVEETTEPLVRVLSQLPSLSPQALQIFAHRIAAGTAIFIKTHAEHIKGTSQWEGIFRLLVKFRDHSQAAESSFHTLDYVVDNYATYDNFTPLQASLLAFVQPHPDRHTAWVRPRHVFDCLVKLHNKLSNLIADDVIDEHKANGTTPPPPPIVATAAAAASNGEKPLSIVVSSRAEGEEMQSSDDANGVPTSPKELARMRAREREHAKEAETQRLRERRKAERKRAATDKQSMADREVQRNDLWLTSLQGLATMCNDPRSDVRRMACDSLQQCLLASRVKMNANDMSASLSWRAAFDRIIVPLLNQVVNMKPEPLDEKPVVVTAARSTPKNGSNTSNTSVDGPPPLYDIRLKIATMLFQAFLHNMDALARLPDFNMFWLKLLGSLERYLKIGGIDTDTNGAISQHFAESLKNVLLVMHASGIFVSASQRTGQDLWALTWSVLDTCRPDLRYSLTNMTQPGMEQAAVDGFVRKPRAPRATTATATTSASSPTPTPSTSTPAPSSSAAVARPVAAVAPIVAASSPSPSPSLPLPSSAATVPVTATSSTIASSSTIPAAVATAATVVTPSVRPLSTPSPSPSPSPPTVAPTSSSSSLSPSLTVATVTRSASGPSSIGTTATANGPSSSPLASYPAVRAFPTYMTATSATTTTAGGAHATTAASTTTNGRVMYAAYPSYPSASIAALPRTIPTGSPATTNTSIVATSTSAK